MQRIEISVPSGPWAIGVSGGADSVALLHLLRERNDLQLHVAHLDHETRAGASGDDAEFVRALCAKLQTPCTIAKRSDVERDMIDLPTNIPARFRRVRLKFFRDVVQQHQLNGIILAHHADDQAETIFQRLVRGSGISGLIGMSPDSRIGELRIVRPLLDVSGDSLRECLRARNIAWREDESNRSPEYQRNQVRMLLGKFSNLRETALGLGLAARELVSWTRENSSDLAYEFEVQQVQKLSAPLARESLRRWLVMRGLQEISPDAIERLLQMCLDAATPARQQFAGGVFVRRRAGKISAFLR